MFYLTEKNLQFLRLGSLLFGTGGGLPFSEHEKFFVSALSVKKRIPVKKISEFSENDFLVSAYGLGDPSLIPNGFKKILSKGIGEYQKLTGLKIKGLIPGEIGSEGMAFLVAAFIGLPVVDSDLVGGRAAPEIKLDCFSVFKKPITPLLGLTVSGKQIFLKEKTTAQKAEKIFRPFFQKNSGSGILIGYPIKAGEYQKIGMAGTISNTICAGKLLKEKKLDQLLEVFSGNLVGQEKILKAEFNSGSGFLEGQIYFPSFSIKVKNENLKIFQKNKPIANAPNLICLLDKDFLPIHNTDLEKYLKKTVKIIVFKSQGYWQKKENKKRWEFI
jgi:DUF917 family protein